MIRRLRNGFRGGAGWRRGRLLLAAASVVAALLGPACEENGLLGPGDTPDVAPVYVPLIPRASWVRVTTVTEGATSWTFAGTDSITGTETVDGIAYYVQQNGDGGRTYLRYEGDTLFMLDGGVARKIAGDTGRFGELPLLRFGLTRDDGWVLYSETDGTTSVLILGYFEGRDTVDSPAADGGFASCPHFRIITSVTSSPVGGARRTTVEERHIWLAENVGPVKETVAYTQDGIPSGSEITSLLAYHIPDTTAFRVSGTVVDSTGAPLADVLIGLARVTADAIGSPGIAIHADTTDVKGAWSLPEVKNGAYTVLPHLDGYTFSPASQVVEVHGGELTVPAFMGTPLPERFTISGRVTDESGAGIPGVVVRTADGRSASTDADGRYVIGGLENGDYAVSLTHPDWIFDTGARAVTIDGESVREIAFTGRPSPRAFDIFGAVADSAGVPMPGVTITVTGPDGSSTVAVTPRSGLYRLAGFTAGMYLVTPSRTGWRFSPAQHEISIADAAPGPVDFTGFAATAGFTVSGTIDDLNGDPLPGISVILSNALAADLSPLPTGMRAVTDKSGAFRFTDVPAGEYLVAPVPIGMVFEPSAAAVTVTGDTDGIRFTGRAVEGYTVSGVISESSGSSPEGVPQPVFGVEVTLTGADETGDTRTFSARTDSTGTYTIGGVPSGAYAAVPADARYTFDPAAAEVIIDGADVTGIDFTAFRASQQGYTVSGIVVDRDNISVPGVALTLSPSIADSLTVTVFPQARTDDHGAFAFAGVSPGAYTIVPVLAGRTFDPRELAVTVRDASVVGLVFVASEAAAPTTHAIGGAISDVSGAPLAGVEVTAVSMSAAGDSTASVRAISGNDGAYRIVGLPDGVYTVKPASPGLIFSPPAVDVRLAGADTTGVNFTGIAGGFRVSGTVADSTGVPIAGFEVKLALADSARRTLTDSTGAFVFKDIAPGTYMVGPNPNAGWTFTPKDLEVTVRSADVTGLAFSGSQIKYTIRGRITTATGAGLDQAQVRLEGGATPIYARTQQDGSYAFPGIPAGPHRVTPVEPGYTFSPEYRDIVTGDASADDTGDVTGVDFTVTGSTTPATGAAVYLPLAPGVSFTFRVTTVVARDNAPTEPYTYTVSVGGTVTLNGMTYYTIDSTHPSNDTPDYIRIDGDRLVEREGPDDPERIFLDLGASSWLAESGSDSSGSFTDTGYFDGFETVTVPAGTFADCCHFSHERVWQSSWMSPNGGTVVEMHFETEESWFAPGIGPVKFSYYETSDGTVVAQYEEELVGYSLPATPSSDQSGGGTVTTPQ